MSDHQTGTVPEKIVAANYPLDKREEQYQKETRQKKAYMVTSENSPTIELEQKQSGVIGSTPASSGKPLREPISDVAGDPERNFHDQYVKEGQVDHSPGAFNR